MMAVKPIAILSNIYFLLGSFCLFSAPSIAVMPEDRLAQKISADLSLISRELDTDIPAEQALIKKVSEILKIIADPKNSAVVEAAEFIGKKGAKSPTLLAASATLAGFVMELAELDILGENTVLQKEIFISKLARFNEKLAKNLKDINATYLFDLSKRAARRILNKIDELLRAALHQVRRQRRAPVGKLDHE